MRHLNVLWKIDNERKMYMLLNNWGDTLEYQEVSFYDDLMFYRQHTGLFYEDFEEINLTDESINITSNFQSVDKSKDYFVGSASRVPKEKYVQAKFVKSETAILSECF